MRLGDKYSDGALASLIFSARETIAKWRDPKRKEAPTLTSLLACPEDVFVALVRELFAARARLGHEEHRLASDVDVEEKRLAEAFARASAANAELTALISQIGAKR